MGNSVRFLFSGDSALVIEFGNEISVDINKKIRKMMDDIKKENIDGIVELVPTYCSLLINYDVLKIDYNTLVEKLKTFLNNDLETAEGEEVTLIEIPTLYNDEVGPDLSYVAEHNKLSKEEVIKIHTGTDYLVYMLGFMPGFTYLGGMSEKIATPRLESPRLQIYPGSVGIAGKQTGMYPSMSPGGWRIIGRTPLKLYNPDSDTPVYISSGDYVRYVSISEEEYNDILKKVENDEYKLSIRKIKRGELNA
ncbi:5-oxoprolinase subunit PxpB [Fusobacterium periodonticum]|uniref:5-oxoprolinase subunit PxpB n=1 Tax=Fusobacterium periodonticum TaxID=860 RepID=UPI0019592BA3|nr:5-oxoprolinase subunit PxpB [Fusobacterium periodonticum]MDU2235312.1 5-oxoprolinase subunit PxpB [Fusobacterium periodonticum]VTX73080.1 Kinase A inhibitor [Fusobacterium periodonticum]